MVLTTLMAAPQAPGLDGHRFGPDALPPPTPAFHWPAPRRVTAAARALRRWVQSLDAWYQDNDPRPFPAGDEAVAAAAVAWALSAALSCRSFPDNLSSIMTEADLAVEYDFVPVDVALRAAANHASYRTAVEAVWALGDPQHTAPTLTSFACGLAQVISSDDDTTVRAVVLEWSAEAYDQCSLDTFICDRVAGTK